MTRPPVERSAGTPTLAVVIPSYRRLAGLPALVHRYREQRADQIVLVLDGPHPGWEDALVGVAGEDVRIVALTENIGLARARIEGLRAADADVILAVDDDVLPGPGLVARHRAFHRATANAVLLGYMPVALPQRRGLDQSPTYIYARDYERQARVWDAGDSEAILGSLWGGNLSLPRSLYLRAESVRASVRLEYNEDLDLGLRLIRCGATASFDRTARATHHHARGLAPYLQECVARGGAVADLERRWGARPPQLTPLVTIPRGYNPVLGALQRWLARHDRPDLLEHALNGLYRGAGRVRAWSLQDGVARLLRRALMMRGYRLSRVSPDRVVAKATTSA